MKKKLAALPVFPAPGVFAAAAAAAWKIRIPKSPLFSKRKPSRSAESKRAGDRAAEKER
ncbi:MAG: hypothetical protein ACI3WR_07745 [Oscillospiraceae bacterium]